MSYKAIDWWHEHAHEYVDLHREPVLYAIAFWLARRANEDPRQGAYPSQDELARAAQVKDRQTVKAATDELARRGVIVVKPNDAPKEGRRGPRGHRYLWRALLPIEGIPTQDSPGIESPIPGSVPQEDPGNPVPNTGTAPASDSRHSIEYRESEGRIPGIRGSNTGNEPAQDPAGRVLEGFLEEEGPRKRGCRCPENYTPTDDLRAWARGRGFTDAALAEITSQFVDYWRAKTGQGATKLDWDGTWRNWVRKEDVDRCNRRVRSLRAVSGGDTPKPYRHGRGVNPWDL